MPLSSICFVISAALGIAAYWVPKLLGPAVAFLAAGHVLGGR